MKKDILYRLFANKATDAERSSVRAWVEASEENRRTYMDERKFFDTASMLADTFCDDFTENRRVWFFRKWAGRAAAAVAIVALTLGAERLAHTYAEPENLPMQQLNVPPGQRLNVVLADGTSVWLNSNSSMKFPGAFVGKKRTVEIDGEAFFAVAKDTEHPFSVSTCRGEIEVTGTKFNVDAYSTGNDFVIELVEGGVNFSDGVHTTGMTPGQKLMVTSDGNINVGMSTASPSEWISGIVSFQELPMQQIMEKFEKYYGIEIEMPKQFSCDEQFSGKFYIDDGIEHALDVLRRDIKFSYTSDKDKRFIAITPEQPTPGGKRRHS